MAAAYGLFIRIENAMETRIQFGLSFKFDMVNLWDWIGIEVHGNTYRTQNELNLVMRIALFLDNRVANCTILSPDVKPFHL